MGVSTLSSFSRENRCSFQGHPPWVNDSTSPLGSTWKWEENQKIVFLKMAETFRNNCSFQCHLRFLWIKSKRKRIVKQILDIYSFVNHIVCDLTRAKIWSPNGPKFFLHQIKHLPLKWKLDWKSEHWHWKTWTGKKKIWKKVPLGKKKSLASTPEQWLTINSEGPSSGNITVSVFKKKREKQIRSRKETEDRHWKKK